MPLYTVFNPLSANLTKWSNTLKQFFGWSNTFKQFVGNSRRIVCVYLTILWAWRLKSSDKLNQIDGNSNNKAHVVI